MDESCVGDSDRYAKEKTNAQKDARRPYHHHNNNSRETEPISGKVPDPVHTRLVSERDQKGRRQTGRRCSQRDHGCSSGQESITVFVGDAQTAEKGRPPACQDMQPENQRQVADTRRRCVGFSLLDDQNTRDRSSSSRQGYTTSRFRFRRTGLRQGGHPDSPQRTVPSRISCDGDQTKTGTQTGRGW